MSVAFTPNDRPPRLIRYVSHLEGDLLSTYDYEQNLLVVCRPLFDRLDKQMKRDVLRTHCPALELIIPTPKAA
jgi:hypothetical protein